MRNEEPLSDAPLKQVVRLEVEQKIRNNKINPATKTGPFKGHRHEHIIQEEILKSQWKGYTLGPTTWRLYSMELEGPVFARRFVQLQARFRRQRKREKRQGTRKETGKGDIKGKGPKGTSPSGKSNKPVCPRFQKGQRQNRYPHVIVGIRQNAHTTNPKVDAHGRIRVYSSTQAKLVKSKMVRQLLPCNWMKQKSRSVY